MCTKNGYRFGHKIFTKTAACAFALVAMSVYCEGAPAEHGSAPTRTMQARAGMFRSVDIEKAFWLCDYTATTRGVHAVPIALCSAVTDELKHEKFGGHSQQLLEWWQQNKPVEHERLANDR